MAFGGETIDHYGVIRDFPALSMVTGLLANALGWERAETARHDRLQQRLVFGARLDRPGHRLTDFQTAQLGKGDTAWTTAGLPEGRTGGPNTYDSPHLRHRDYHADACVLVALRLEPADEPPTLDDLAGALDHPQRPLFLGRKPCLPHRHLFAGWREAVTVLAALCVEAPPAVRLQWPEGEGSLTGDRGLSLCDIRNWRSGVHGGARAVRQGTFHPLAGRGEQG